MHTVHKSLGVYNYNTVQTLLTKVRSEFGQPANKYKNGSYFEQIDAGARWAWYINSDNTDTNSGNIVFVFKDEADALMFNLKY